MIARSPSTQPFPIPPFRLINASNHRQVFCTTRHSPQRTVRNGAGPELLFLCRLKLGSLPDHAHMPPSRNPSSLYARIDVRTMASGKVSVQEAAKLSEEGKYTYLDVRCASSTPAWRLACPGAAIATFQISFAASMPSSRTEKEFAASHPKGASNIQWAFAGDSGFTPNPDFVSEVLWGSLLGSCRGRTDALLGKFSLSGYRMGCAACQWALGGHVHMHALPRGHTRSMRDHDPHPPSFLTFDPTASPGDGRV